MYNRMERIAIEALAKEIRPMMASTIFVQIDETKRYWVSITLGLGHTFKFNDGQMAVAHLSGIKAHLDLEKRLNEKAKGTFNEN